jgi:membrane-associated phospholipid phosphatase
MRCTTVIVCVVLTLGGTTAFAEGETDIEGPANQEEALSVEYQQIPQPTADRNYRLQWHFKPAHWAEGVTAGVLGVAAIALAPVHVERRWTGQNAFDDWFRRRLMATSAKQERYDTASDVLTFTSIGFPVLVDLIGVTLIGDRNKEVGLQLFAIQAQAFAISGFVTNVVKLSGRERPWALDANCASGAVDCSKSANKSYFSSHTSLAFTGAGLTCAEHRHLKLFGRVGDPIACASVLALATTTGVFRVVANRHWMTDVLTGAGVGLVAGWLMPWLMHYRHDLIKREQGKKRHLYYLAPYGNAGAIGLSAAGAF